MTICFPCPHCGTEFHFNKAGDIRMSAPCGSCGQILVMPHGSFGMTHATTGIGLGGASDVGQKVPGFWSGGITIEQVEKLEKANRRSRKPTPKTPER